MSAPLVSVITATYNRSNVLALAIESVRWQTFGDWELWVIGDACTDDTAQVVASFAAADPRIHFLNLEQNVGEQSGPNNAGCQRARGRYIAYLNHDDLWLPDHLAVAVKALEETGADLIFTVIEMVRGDGPNRLSWAGRVSRLTPPGLAPASCWCLRRELIEEIGPWRFYQDCYNFPSQDWLFRAWRAGKDLRSIPRLTVVAIQSGMRPGSYAARQIEEHRLYFDRIASEPDFRERELAAIGAADEAEALRRQRQGRAWWRKWSPLHTLPQRAFWKAVWWVSIAAKIDPLGAALFLRRFRKGERLDQLRQIRGLPALSRRRRTGRKG